MTAAVCDPQLTVVGAAVYRSYSARLFDRHALVNTRKRTEQNLFVCSDKSKAEVTIRRLRSTYCTIEAN